MFNLYQNVIILQCNIYTAIMQICLLQEDEDGDEDEESDGIEDEDGVLDDSYYFNPYPSDCDSYDSE